jgi:hypothetical protein
MNKVEEKQTFAPKEEIEEKVSGKLLASIYIIYVNSADSIITNPPFWNGSLDFIKYFYKKTDFSVYETFKIKSSRRDLVPDVVADDDDDEEDEEELVDPLDVVREQCSRDAESLG